jgi:hypothetical protein
MAEDKLGDQMPTETLNNRTESRVIMKALIALLLAAVALSAQEPSPKAR